MGIVVPKKSWETIYYAVETRGVSETVKTQFTASGTTSEEWALHDIIVDNIHIWLKDDVAFLQGTTGSDGKEIVVHVVGKDTATS